MKRICTYLYLYIIAAAALVACDDSGKYITEPTLDKVQFGVTAEVPDSRTALTQGEDGIYRAIWKSGDNIRIAQIADSSAVEYSDHILTEDAEKVEIIASFSQSSASQFTYVLASPSVVVNEDFSTLSLTLPAEQTPSALETFDGNADILISDALNLEAQPTGQSIDFAVNRLSAVGKMTITNLALTDGDKVTSVTFTASQPLAGTIKNIYTSNLVAGKLQTTDFTFTDSSNSVKVNLPQAQSGSFTYFMCCLPTTLSTGEQYTVTVRTEQGRYTKSATIPTPLEFIEGQITSCTINMSGIALDTTPEDETTTYNIGDLVTINGTKGVVFQTTPNIKIVSAEEASLQWGSANVLGVQTGAISTTDGAYNMSIIKAISDYENNYPAFKWCADLGEDWYLPSYDELFVMDNDLSVVNKTLTDNGFSALASQESVYWSSSEYVDSSNNYAHNVNLSTGVMNIAAKNTTARVRAVLVIGDNPATSQILYTSTDGNVVTPFSSTVFGANIVSNTYDSSLGLGTITFDGEVTQIGVRAFDGCTTLSGITIPQSVTTIGMMAFEETALSSITIPDNVTTIGEYAFRYCSSLKEFKGNYASEDGRCLVLNGVLNSFASAEIDTYIIPNDITAIGDGAFANSTLSSVTLPESITLIGSSAFSVCHNLTSINIPAAVTAIDNWAFFMCDKLAEVNITDLSAWFRIEFGGEVNANPLSYSNSVVLMLNGEKITDNIVIPEDITELKNYALHGYDSFTNVVLHSGITAIGNGTFKECNNLNSITLPASITTIGIDAFYACTALTSVYSTPTTPPTLGERAFQKWGDGDYANLDCKIYVPAASVSAYKTANGWNTYADAIVADSSSADPANCVITYTSTDGKVVTPYSTTGFGANIVSNTYENGQGVITFDGKVTQIGSSAFRNCTSLASITIPDSVTEIGGSSAFRDCTNLASITIPDSVTNIESYAFYNCSNLKDVYYTGDISAWCKISFEDYYANPLFYGAKLYIDNKEVTEVTIPSDVTEIKDYAFYKYISLASVTISDSVTTIGRYAFSGCSGLTAVTIGNGVTEIGGSAFSGCSSLASITIPDSVTSIGSSAFRECSNLTSVTIGNGVTEIKEDTFENCSSLTSITIGKGITSIDTAFIGCSGLKDVYYTGDISAWCKISFDNLNAHPLRYGAKLYIDNKVVTEVTIPSDVTEIKDYTFYKCSSLASVTIPDSVTKIGHSAFSGCSGLTSVTIGNGVTEIGYLAFNGCSRLTSVTIGNSVTSIGSAVFGNCSRLKDVYYTGDISAWCKISFESGDANPLYYGAKLYIDNKEVSEVTIPSDVAEIKDYAFYKYSSLASVTISDSVTSIGNYAFSGCSGLTAVTIGNGVTSIGNYVFSGCGGLTSVTIGNGVTEIGMYAFSGCSSLTSITIPDSVTTIGDRAFSGCSSLTSVTIGNGITLIEWSVFDECSSLKDVYYTGDISAWCKISFENSDANPLYYGAKLYIDNKEVTEITIPSDITEIKDYAFMGCTSLASITIPDSVTTIGESTFYNCSNLTSVTIGNRVTTIGSSAFSGCSGLTSVTIGNGVTEIGMYAFSGCSSLTSITIPDGVLEIKSNAFYNCSSLVSVYCKPTTPPILGGAAFNKNAADRKIYVPTASVDTYKAVSDWSDYVDAIVGY